MTELHSDYPYPQDSLHGAPSAIELVESVREWLERDVSPQVEGRLRFHTRVATNALATVQRELELGPGQEAAHRSRLERLGVSSERELADAVRGGAFDERTDELIEALRETVVDRLRVANPRYLDE